MGKSALTIQERKAFIRDALDKYGDTVYLVALNQTRSSADAEDVSQDIFTRLPSLDALETTFTNEEHLKRWLIRVTLNACHDLHRHPWKSQPPA